jgi:phosphinothricin acetyltransferase
MAVATPFAIRDAAEADIPAIAAILNHEILHSTATWTTAPRDLVDVALWYGERRVAGFPVLVAESGGAVIGYGSYGPFRAGQGYRFTVEHSVYVAADARGAGVGGALLGALCDRARAAGLHAMVGGIGAENEGSLRLHARHGFAETGRLPAVGFKFGRWLDLVIMQKLL